MPISDVVQPSVPCSLHLVHFYILNTFSASTETVCVQVYTTKRLWFRTVKEGGFTQMLLNMLIRDQDLSLTLTKSCQSLNTTTELFNKPSNNFLFHLKKLLFLK